MKDTHDTIISVNSTGDNTMSSPPIESASKDDDIATFIFIDSAKCIEDKKPFMSADDQANNVKVDVFMEFEEKDLEKLISRIFKNRRMIMSDRNVNTSKPTSASKSDNNLKSQTLRTNEDIRDYEELQKLISAISLNLIKENREVVTSKETSALRSDTNLTSQPSEANANIAKQVLIEHMLEKEYSNINTVDITKYCNINKSDNKPKTYQFTEKAFRLFILECLCKMRQAEYDRKELRREQSISKILSFFKLQQLFILTVNFITFIIVFIFVLYFILI